MKHKSTLRAVPSRRVQDRLVSVYRRWASWTLAALAAMALLALPGCDGSEECNVATGAAAAYVNPKIESQLAHGRSAASIVGTYVGTYFISKECTSFVESLGGGTTGPTGP
jgi:hypothetical protein